MNAPASRIYVTMMIMQRVRKVKRIWLMVIASYLLMALRTILDHAKRIYTDKLEDGIVSL